MSVRSSNRRLVVVTGARGYIATALAKRLSDRGHALRLVSRSLEKSRLAADLHAESLEADLRDETAWLSLMQGADVIVHLSSRTDLRAAEVDPGGDNAINVEPIRTLVSASAKTSFTPKVVFASTVTIVGATHDHPVDERTPDHPCSVYDRHKLAGETILREATTQGHLSACSLRLSNVYGLGGASANANRGILNIMLQRSAAGEVLTLFGKGDYIRDFIHVDDVVDAFTAAVELDEVGGGNHYVISTGQGHTLAEAYRLIADQAFAATGRRIEIQRVAEPPDLHPIERRNFIGNSSLFRRLTGWQPRISLEQGIEGFFAATRTRSERPAHQL
jgi:nucleoside-diphosphate-sugar epimerase